MPRRLHLSLLSLFTGLLLSVGSAHAELQKPHDFRMTDLDGKEHKLSDYRGRWVILNFWATWCPPCQEEIPELIAYHDAHPDQAMLGINFESIETGHLKAYVAEQGMDFPVLPIGDKLLPGLEPIVGLPTTIIITPKGELIAKHTGPVTRQALEDFIAGEQAAARAGK